MTKIKAIVFDCDGVLAETERDGHRVAFNRTFAEEHIPVAWDIEEYGGLLRIAGGKERMKYYFDHHADKIQDRVMDDAYIQKLHLRKTEIFSLMGANGLLPARTGIKRMRRANIFPA